MSEFLDLGKDLLFCQFKLFSCLILRAFEYIFPGVE